MSPVLRAAITILVPPILALAPACDHVPGGGPGAPAPSGPTDPGPTDHGPATAAADPYLAPVLLDPHGRTVRLADFKGRVRIFDIWASWCGPCRMGIPHLNAVYNRYRERGVVVVGISVDDSPADVLAFEKQIPLRYPNGMSNPQTLALFGETPAIPTTFVVDREGRLRQIWRGMVDARALEEAILGLL